MFGDKVPTKNKRMNAKEYETELWISKLFNRPPRQYNSDFPYYPYLKPEPLVNFDLKYK